MKAAEQYFPVVLFTMPDKTVLLFESVDKILQYDHEMMATEHWGVVYYT